MRMDPLEYHGCKIDEDLVEFIDETCRIMVVMRVPSKEKAKLIAYQLKGIDKVWYDQWIEERGE